MRVIEMSVLSSPQQIWGITMSDLEALRGKMHRAAIDCYMADDGFLPNWIDGSYYSKWGFVPYHYRRPSEDGVGGGEQDKGTSAGSIAPVFDQIRSSIDAVIDPWRGELPTGEMCSAPKSAADGVMTALGTSSSDNPLILTSNTLVKDAIGRMLGSFRSPFLDKYHTQVARIARSNGDLAILLKANYAAGEALWPEVPDNVYSICEAAHNQWASKVDEASAAAGAIALTIVGAVAGVVSSVVTAGAGLAWTVAALSTVAATSASALKAIEATSEITGDTYPDILQSLSDALGDLNGAISKQESILTSMMNDAVSAVRGELGNFNLDAFELERAPYEEQLRMTRSDAQTVRSNMVRIAEALQTTRSTLGAEPPENPTPRPVGIGLSQNGSQTAASTLHVVLARCLELTEGEYANGQALFDATERLFFDADAAARAEVDRLMADELLTTPFGV